MMDVFNDTKAACGNLAAATLATLTRYLYTMYTLIHLNGTDDNCTDGRFTIGLVFITACVVSA